jgi:quinol monooxygenase YgiN
MISVVAVIRAKAGKEKELEPILKKLVKPTQQEKGCIQYDLHRNSADASEFVFVERWSAKKELDAHLNTPHIALAMARKDELIEVLDIKVLSRI